MLDKIKLSLRIKTSTFDDEIRDLISACKRDLALAGVNRIIENDALIQRAIILYCKANFGFDDEDDKFHKAYQALKASLSLAGDYSNV